jgi:hypothetical protein
MTFERPRPRGDVMAYHCLACQRHQYDEYDPTNDCPGVTCPECADAAEWHKAIMAETCREDEHHCTCVPILRVRIKELNAALEDAMTLRVIPKRGPFIPDEPACPECAGTQLKLAILGKVLELLTKCDEKDAEITRLSALLVSESELHLVAVASLHNLERATRKVVEALRRCITFTDTPDNLTMQSRRRYWDAALANPVIVALGRE